MGMRDTRPKVRLISAPSVRWEEVEAYLTEIGGLAWLERIDQQFMSGRPVPAGEALVEFCGRGCYGSWDIGLNPNIIKIREDRGEYLGNLIGSRHGSVLEHANYTFIFQDVSRVFTHELITHRVGVAKSQESLRYVRLTDIGFRIPDIMEPFRERWTAVISMVEELQQDMAAHFELDADGTPFEFKKQITSAMRRIAFEGLSTTIIWTANVRTLRFLLSARTDLGAEEEMRWIFDRVGVMMRCECPLLFKDFERQDSGEWVTENWKV
jgi:thymidylate synthase (FAD)